MLKYLKIVGILWISLLIPVEACTGIKLVAKDGTIAHGRTLEFGIDIQTSVVVIPRDYEFTGTTPLGSGLKYKAKYGAVGCIAFDNLSILDGINEKGLAVGVFYFPGFSGYSKVNNENQSKALSPIEFSNWIITQFASIQEVKDALSDVIIAPTVYKEWGNEVPPFHYIVYDKTGKSLVIEPINGKLITYDNPWGVFTNSPTFDWHMTNLRNFINLQPENVPPLKIDGVELTAFGQGSGMVGLPGDFTPPSRFVRAAIFSQTAIPSANADDAILQIFHILNQFDIPRGVSRETVNGIIHSDYTLVTCARNPQSLQYYFKTYDNQSLCSVDLKKFDLSVKTVKRLLVNAKEQIKDVSENLK